MEALCQAQGGMRFPSSITWARTQPPRQLSAGHASHSSPEQFFLVTFTLLQTPRFSREVAAGLGSAGGAVLTSSASSCQQGAPSGAVAAVLLELLRLTPASSSFSAGLPMCWAASIFVLVTDCGSLQSSLV